MILQEGTGTDAYVVREGELLQEIRIGSKIVYKFPGIPDTEVWYQTRTGNLIKPQGLLGITRNYSVGTWNVIEFKNYLHVMPGSKNYGCGCFQGASDLKKMHLPACHTSIGARCFQGCTGLESFEFPGSLKEIGDHCFHGCTGIRFIVFDNPEPPVFIGSGAFMRVPVGIPVFVPKHSGALYRNSEVGRIFNNIIEL